MRQIGAYLYLLRGPSLGLCLCLLGLFCPLYLDHDLVLCFSRDPFLGLGRGPSLCPLCRGPSLFLPGLCRCPLLLSCSLSGLGNNKDKEKIIEEMFVDKLRCLFASLSLPKQTISFGWDDTPFSFYIMLNAPTLFAYNSLHQRSSSSINFSLTCPPFLFLFLSLSPW